MLEEIVGEITDEYDEDEVEVEYLDAGAFRVSSRFPIDDLDELVGFDVHDEDVDSVGGLMAKHLGRVPIPGSVVETATACASRPSAPPVGATRSAPCWSPCCRTSPSTTVTWTARSAPPAGDQASRDPSVPEARTRVGRMTDLTAEDAKLVTLARATRARTGAAEGAAVRDLDGRTYAAATVGWSISA